MTLRGEFPNPKGELLPGMYVRVRIEQGIDNDAIAVPQQAVQRNDDGGSEVFVVKDDNRVVAAAGADRARRRTASWLVIEGLKPGDRVVVDGFQKFAAGDKVKPQLWTEADASRRTAEKRQTKPDAARGERSRMPSFFIDRPIFAWVVALFICLIGVICDPAAAGRAVSDHRAALDLDQRPAIPAPRRRTSTTA